MKIGLSSTACVVSFTDDEYATLTQVSSRVCPDGRVRAIGQFENGAFRLTFTPRGNVLFKDPNGAHWRAQFTPRNANGLRVAPFTMTPALWENVNDQDIIARITGTPGAVHKGRGSSVKATSPKRSYVRRAAPVTAVASAAALTGQAQTRPLNLTDAELLSLRDRVNAAVEAGFRLVSDDAGRILYFERRVG